MLLVRILLFLLINLFNFGIFEVAISYLNPDFGSGFLAHKTHLEVNEIFHYGLIIHGISACIVLFLCSLLVLFRMEVKFRAFHKFAGKVALILLFACVVPGGIILSFYADGGKTGKFLFFMLAIYTAYTARNAYVQIRRKNILLHKLYMKELLCLLTSAIILRISLILFSTMAWINWNTSYICSILISWIPTLLIFAIIKQRKQKLH